MGDSSLLKGLLFFLCIAVVVLIFMPKDCAKNVAPVAALRKHESAPKGLRIDSSTPAPSPQGQVTWPAGLTPQRLQYLIEIDSAFAEARTAQISKGGHLDDTAPVVAMKSLGYLTTQPDGTYVLTTDGLLNANATDQGSSWVIPVAKREYLQAAKIDCIAPDQCTVTFKWQWRPNKIGEAMQLQPSPRDGAARLLGGANQWVVMDVHDIN